MKKSADKRSATGFEHREPSRVRPSYADSQRTLPDGFRPSYAEPSRVRSQRTLPDVLQPGLDLVNGVPRNPMHMNAQHVNAQDMNAQHMNAQHVNAQYMNAQHMNAQHVNAQHVNAQECDTDTDSSTESSMSDSFECPGENDMEGSSSPDGRKPEEEQGYHGSDEGSPALSPDEGRCPELAVNVGN